MNDIEDELRRLLADAAPEPRAASGPRLPVAERRRVRWLVPVAAAAVVLAVVAIAVSLGGAKHDAGSGAGGAAPSAPSPGMRQVAYGGITLRVPRDYVVGPSLCSMPKRDAVVPFDGEHAACPMIPAGQQKQSGQQRYTTVALALSDHPDIPADRPTTVDGVPARTGTGTADGQRSTVLVVPSRGVSVVVTAPNDAAAQAILRTVQLVPVDALGCRDRAAALDAGSNPASAGLMAGRPVSAVACEYLNGHRLVGSGRLTAAQLSVLVADLQRATRSPHGAVATTLRVRYLLRYADGSTRMIEMSVDEEPAIATNGRAEFVVPLRQGPNPTAYGGVVG